jgi:hypothetical protein
MITLELEDEEAETLLNAVTFFNDCHSVEEDRISGEKILDKLAYQGIHF